MSARLKLFGTVISGRGNAASLISVSSHELEAKLGENLVKGSLNIVLRRPIKLNPENAIVFGDGSRLLWPASIGDCPVWVFRWRHSPLHILEVLSAVHLRTTLGLVDGDGVTVEVRRTDVALMSLESKLAWGLFWIGRQNWYYTGDKYKEHAKRWCRYCAATQPGVKKQAIEM